MKKMLFLLICASSFASYGQQLYGLDIKLPSDYAKECERFGEKTDPDKRGSSCLSFLQGMKIGMMARRASAKCVEEISSIAPMLLHDALLSMKAEKMSVYELSEEFVEVFAKSCNKRR
jgi:hypothetical protein